MTTSTKLLSATTDVRINIGSGLSGVTRVVQHRQFPNYLTFTAPLWTKALPHSKLAR